MDLPQADSPWCQMYSCLTGTVVFWAVGLMRIAVGEQVCNKRLSISYCLTATIHTSYGYDVCNEVAVIVDMMEIFE